MSLFRSLYLREEKEKELQSFSERPWPSIFRDSLPTQPMSHYSLLVKIESQLPKSIDMKQLFTMPSFNENRRITSKAGWTYYGHWKGITFQTLFSLFANAQIYPWVRMESMTGLSYVINRQDLMNYRIVTECDGKPLSSLYGGPLWIHNFDYYIEYSIPHVKTITLMQHEAGPSHPMEKLGFDLSHARVEHGKYYDIHHEKIATL